MSDPRAGAMSPTRVAALKLLSLAVAVTLLVILRSPVTVTVGAVGAVALYVATRPGLRGLYQQVRPVRWFALVMIAFHVIVGRGSPDAWAAAATVTGTLVVTVALAGWVTATTSTTAILDVVERALTPLRFIGVDPVRAALMLALALRSLPIMADLATRTRDAARARGVDHSVRAQVVPLVVSGLRYADRLGEALVARGADDPVPDSAR